MAIAVTIYVAMHERPAFDWRLTRRMLRFCWPLWLSGIAGLYIGSSGAIYLRFFDSLGDVGRLELGLKLASTVGVLLWAPFSQHWEPMSFRYYRAVNGERKFQVAFTALAAVLVAGALGVSIFAEPVIRVMAAKPFQTAAGIVPMLALGFVLNRLSSFFNFSFIVTGHTKVHSVCQYATAVVITLAYLLLVPRYGLVGAAYAQLIGYAAGFGLVRVLSRRYYDPGYRFGPFAVFLLIGAIAYVASTLASWRHSVVFDLGVKSMAWSAAAALIAWIAVRSIASLDADALAELTGPLGWVTRLVGGRGQTQV
jgi:O-antigen/teichoic acid export membrane protein